MMRKILCSFLALSLVFLSCSKDDVNETTNNVDIVDSITITQEILELVNQHRLSIGMSSLNRNSYADGLAEDHTEYMIGKKTISHDNFAVRFVSLQKELSAKSAGENVAYGYATAKTVMDGWINSPGHKANIEGDFTHIGIAAIKDVSGKYYYAQLFFR